MEDIPEDEEPINDKILNSDIADEMPEDKIGP